MLLTGRIFLSGWYPVRSWTDDRHQGRKYYRIFPTPEYILLDVPRDDDGIGRWSVRELGYNGARSKRESIQYCNGASVSE